MCAVFGTKGFFFGSCWSAGTLCLVVRKRGTGAPEKAAPFFSGNKNGNSA